MESIPMETEMITNVFKYFQEDAKSTSTLDAAGGNQVIIPLNNMLISPNTTLYLPIENINALPTLAQNNAHIHQRQLYIGDKRFLSNVQRIFNSVQFTSNEITMQSAQNTDIVNNLLYYKNNKRILENTPERIKTANHLHLKLYFDPLVTHDQDNTAFTGGNFDRLALVNFQTPINVALPELAAGACRTFLPISFKTLLPGLFDLQETIFVTNASLTLNFTQNPTIQSRLYQQTIVAANDTYAVNTFSQINFRLITGQQAFVQSLNNQQNFQMYKPVSKYVIQEKLWDLQSISQEIIFNSCKFFAFIVIPPQDQITALDLGRDLFQLKNTDIYINTISIGDSILYQQKGNLGLSLQSQKRAFESIMGTEIQVNHLAFFSFDDVQGLQKIKIDIVSGTTAGFKVLVYTISEDPMTGLQ